MIKSNRILSFCAFFCAFSLAARCDFESPTQKYLEFHSMDEIKYNLRLDNTSLIYKELFDKIIPKECEGFIGYHGASLEYRIYQDVIKTIVQEVVGIDVQKDFHFLDIPCFRKQTIDELAQIPQFFQPDKNRGNQISRQLFPINIALYANHDRIGFSSVVRFTTNTSRSSSTSLENDLKDFFQTLGISITVVDDAFEIGKGMLKEDRGILLQLFDSSEEPYSFADSTCYPSYPNGYPFANRAVSEYYEEEANHYPNEIDLLLTDHYTLNPYSPLVIKRYDKMQSSAIKNYEAALTELIKKADYDPCKVKAYRQTLVNTWNQ